MDQREHWQSIYRSKDSTQVSWYQPEAALSRRLIEAVAPDRASRIIDVGSGASTLVDGLARDGYTNITLLDLSAEALDIARTRLGPAASGVAWLVGDALTAAFDHAAFDVWHDRAVFHFLTEPADRARYVAQVCHAVRHGGHVLVATFAEDGPSRCSGLDVARYSPVQLHAEFGRDFVLRESHRETHRTPAGAVQAFTYCLCRYEPATASRPAA